MRKFDFFILTFILFVALLFRLYKINIPLTDLHSWRQADTAAVARNFVKSGFDLLRPRYDDLSNVQSGQNNPQGYRMVEFPIYNAIFACLYKIFPIVSLEMWGRLISVFFSLITIAILYYLLLKESNRLAAFTGSLTYSIMPFFVFFSRVILPESTALGFTMLSVFFLYLFLRKQYNNLPAGRQGITIHLLYILSLISFLLSLLITVFLLLLVSQSKLIKFFLSWAKFFLLLWLHFQLLF